MYCDQRHAREGVALWDVVEILHNYSVVETSNLFPNTGDRI